MFAYILSLNIPKVFLSFVVQKVELLFSKGKPQTYPHNPYSSVSSADVTVPLQ